MASRILKAKPVQHERKMQTAFVQWFHVAHPGLKALLSASANGGSRNPIEARNLKLSGILSGHPDLQLLTPRGSYHGLLVELKIKPNKPSSKQIEVMASLMAHGYAVYVCYTLEEVIQVFTDYLKLGAFNGLV